MPVAVVVAADQLDWDAQILEDVAVARAYFVSDKFTFRSENMRRASPTPPNAVMGIGHNSYQQIDFTRNRIEGPDLMGGRMGI